jgi:hypothetical protein
MTNEIDTVPELPDSLVLAFAPLHKRAFGIAIGTATGLTIALITAVYLIRGAGPQVDLWLLKNYFWGYSPTWKGVLIGGWWGFVAGFVAGWFLAFCRNIIIAISIFLVRTRNELGNTRDFLDHI